MTRRLTTSVLLLTAGMLLVSCGGSDEVSTSTSTTTAPGTAPDDTAPGTAPDDTAPGTAPDDTAPGTAPDDTAPFPTSPGPPAVEIVSFETSFGMCAGWCVSRIDIDVDTVTLVASNRMEETEQTTAGVLTDTGAAELAGAAASLEGVTIDDVYGCPDCADGGASSLTLARGVEIMTTSYDFGGPPPELIEADAVGAGLLDALASCTSSGLVTVEESCEPID